MEQVLINNSIWGKISAEEEKAFIILRVMDSGTGIPKEVLNKIFDPFDTTKLVGEGTGLGLSITKGILDEHGATIRVVEEIENTCFEIKLSKIGGN
jgi:two-component system NtrC family sensor kinase